MKNVWIDHFTSSAIIVGCQFIENKILLRTLLKSQTKDVVFIFPVLMEVLAIVKGRSSQQSAT